MRWRAISWGVAGALALFSLYLAVTTAASGFGFTWQQFTRLWYWFVPLIVGFGAQVGLYTRIRSIHHQLGRGSLVGSGAVSGTAMVACCAHRLVDLLPWLGLTALAVALSQYQTYLLAFGLASNLAGLVYLWRLKQHLPLPAVVGKTIILSNN